MGRGSSPTTDVSSRRGVAGRARDRLTQWARANPDAWRSASFAPENPGAWELLRASLRSGALPEPKDLEFLAVGFPGCVEAASALSEELGDLGVQADGGYYGPAGSSEGGHAWVRLADGTIVDVAYRQFDPDQPVMIARPGTREYDRYVPVELTDDSGVILADSDELGRRLASYRWPFPSWGATPQGWKSKRHEDQVSGEWVDAPAAVQ